jgi:ABC-type transport system involved in multi-copper enzyme maturation permease subunit
MRVPVAPYRSGQPTGSHGFGQLLRAEWTKFRTVRGWVITVAVVALVVVLLAFVGASGSRASFCRGPATCTTGHPPVAIGPGGEPVADSYTFVYQPLRGNGSVTARVSSLSGAATTSNGTPNAPLRSSLQSGLPPWAKAGILIEKTTGQGSAYVAVMVTGSHGVRMQYDYTHDTPGAPGPVTAASPRWLRITRVGNGITGYDSTDGIHWTEIGTAHLTGIPATAQVGLFVTSPVSFASGSNSGNPSVATANFDQIVLRSGFPAASWKGEEIGAYGIYPTVPSASTWHQSSAHAFTISGTGDLAPLVGGGITATDAGASLLVGELAGLIVLIVLATLFITSEYRRGQIRTTFAASPRRARVLVAKAVVVGSIAFVAGVVGTALALVISRKVLAANGNFLFPLSGLAQARIIVGTGLLLGAAAVLALALGTALRRSAGAVVTCAALLVLPFVLSEAMPPGASNWLMRLTPTAAFAVQGAEPRSALVTNAYTVVNGYYPLAPWAGLAVLCGYAAVAVGVSVWLLRRRDV